MLVIRKDRAPLFTFYGSGETAFAQFTPVDKGLRFANRLLDFLFLVVLIAEQWNWFSNTSIILRVADASLRTAELYLFGFFIIILYYTLSESLFKVTFGKLITGTRVVNEEGTTPSFGQALGRTLCRFIPFEPWSFLFNDRGWHDSISGTYVIKERYEWQSNERLPSPY
jgi:uncharacterized RDD family membrane protein YckC